MIVDDSDVISNIGILSVQNPLLSRIISSLIGGLWLIVLVNL